MKAANTRAFEQEKSSGIRKVIELTNTNKVSSFWILLNYKIIKAISFVWGRWPDGIRDRG